MYGEVWGSVGAAYLDRGCTHALERDAGPCDGCIQLAEDKVLGGR